MYVSFSFQLFYTGLGNTYITYTNDYLKYEIDRARFM